MYAKCCVVCCENFSSPRDCVKIIKIPDNGRSPCKISQIVVRIIGRVIIFVQAVIKCNCVAITQYVNETVIQVDLWI